MVTDSQPKCSLEHPHSPKPVENRRHPHGEDPHSAHEHRPLEKRRLLIVLAITSAMMVVEFVMGLLTGSLALVSDAGHMLTHAFAVGVSFGAISIASLPTRKERSFGLYRIEVVAALFNSLTLLVMTGFIYWEGIHRLFAPKSIATTEMLVVAVTGLIVNFAAAMILMGASKHDLNVRSAFLHMLGDTLSSVAIVIGAIVIIFTGWFVVDPILSILIATVILIWAVKLFRESLHVLLETTPRHIRIEDVMATIQGACPDIKHVHDVHIWEITSRMYAMTAHVVIDDIKVSAAQAITRDICRLLNEKHDIEHATIQLEAANLTRKEANEAESRA